MADECGGSKEIQFNNDPKTVRIQIKSYGYFTQRFPNELKPGHRLFITNEGKPDGKIIQMYSYKSTPPVDGTYVVLQFKESGWYVTSQEDEFMKPDPEVVFLKDPREFSPINAEDIKKTDDPRVFLMKPFTGSLAEVSEYMFAIFTLNEARVITAQVPRELKPAVLKPEGNGPKELQYFQIEDVSSECDSKQSDEAVNVP